MSPRNEIAGNRRSAPPTLGGSAVSRSGEYAPISVITCALVAQIHPSYAPVQRLTPSLGHIEATSACATPTVSVTCRHNFPSFGNAACAGAGTASTHNVARTARRYSMDALLG